TVTEDDEDVVQEVELEWDENGIFSPELDGDEADIFVFTGDTDGLVVADVSIVNFTAGQSIDLSGLGEDFSTVSNVLGGVNSILVEGDDLLVTMFSGDSVADLKTWDLTFEDVGQDVLDVVDPDADFDSNLVNVAGELGNDWLLI
ncbi:hypothetical protein LRB11_17095, partial [Ectothiorhodospira haloalkaliphila]|uniref:hypothetical protein n=1 Tax=Ectothiorhodospira haloalkaliphila TaxID=421628 RepID=UPI001EE9A67B